MRERAAEIILAILAATCAFACAVKMLAGAEPNPGLLMSAEKAALLRAAWPECASPKFNALFASADLFWTDAEMPRMQQQQGVFLAPQAGGTRDGNIDFPWATPGGVHNCSGIATFKFLTLPKRSDGTPWPVAALGRQAPAAQTAGGIGVAWWFPVGATIGEVLLLTGPDGRQYTFEARLRQKTARGTEVEILVPYATPKELAEAIQMLRPKWESEPALVAAIDRLANSPRIVQHTVTDRGLHGANGRTTFLSTDLYETLPPLPADLVRELLTDPDLRFVRATDSAWRTTPAGEVWRPTADGFSIVPAKYTGAMLGTNSESCARCHKDTGARSNTVEPTWLGRIRGADDIFSFNPIEPASFGVANMRTHEKLAAAGIVRILNADEHPLDVYPQTAFLRK